MRYPDYAEDVAAFTGRIKSLGFRVFVAKKGHYGCITDQAGKNVVSFSFNDGGSLGGNYGPPSTTSGTGWRMDESPYQIKTAEDVEKLLSMRPPSFCGNGWRYLTTLDQYLGHYASSQLEEAPA